VNPGRGEVACSPRSHERILRYATTRTHRVSPPSRLRLQFSTFWDDRLAPSSASTTAASTSTAARSAAAGAAVVAGAAAAVVFAAAAAAAAAAGSR